MTKFHRTTLTASLIAFAAVAQAEPATWHLDTADNNATSIYIGGAISPLYRICFTGGAATSVEVTAADKTDLGLDSCTDARGTEIRISNRAGDIASGTYEIIAIPGAAGQ